MYFLSKDLIVHLDSDLTRKLIISRYALRFIGLTRDNLDSKDRSCHRGHVS